MLTGHPPFRGATPLDTLLMVISDEPKRPSSVLPRVERDLETIALKCLAKEPQKRYRSAEELADDLQRWLDGLPILARPASRAEHAVKWVRRHPAIAALVGLVALVAGLGLTGIVWQWHQAVAARREAVAARRDAEQKADAETQARKSAELSKQAEADARGKAEAESDAKGKALRQAEGLRLTAQSSATLPSNPGLALLLAMEGAERAAPRQAEHNDALLAALNQCRELRTIMAPPVAPIPNLERQLVFTAVCLSHDGRRIATASVRTSRPTDQSLTWGGKLIQVWDAKTGTRLAEFMVPGLTPATIEFSPDDRLVLTTYQGAALVRYADARRLFTRTTPRTSGIP